MFFLGEEGREIKASVKLLKHMNLVIFFSPPALAQRSCVQKERKKEKKEGKREVFICGDECISHLVCGCSGW